MTHFQYLRKCVNLWEENFWSENRCFKISTKPSEFENFAKSRKMCQSLECQSLGDDCTWEKSMKFIKMSKFLFPDDVIKKPVVMHVFTGGRIRNEFMISISSTITWRLSRDNIFHPYLRSFFFNLQIEWMNLAVFSSVFDFEVASTQSPLEFTILSDRIDFYGFPRSESDSLMTSLGRSEKKIRNI